MADKMYLIEKAILTSIADRIRNKTGKTDKIIFPDGFFEEIQNIETTPPIALPVLDSEYPKDVNLTTIRGQASNAIFNIVISIPGTPAEYTYQWYYDGNALSGENSSSCSIANPTAGQHTIYCEITNEAGTTQSRIATLNVNELYTPVLNASNPANVSVVQSSSASATFKVIIETAGNPASYTYQWYVNGSPVSGATGSSYTKTGLSSAATYNVYCVITNEAGSVNSRTATLQVFGLLPNYTYSGTASSLTDEGNGNWSLKLLTSGTLKFTNLGSATSTGIDIFCVGGGGNGSGGDKTWGGSGGAGGKTSTTKGKVLSNNTNYTITIGGSGGTTSFKQGSTTLASAAGGGSGSTRGAGGSGGSGGGGGGRSSSSSGDYEHSGGKGGTNGGNGYEGESKGGSGQGTNTYEFGTSGKTLYSGGGGGGCGTDGGHGGDGGSGGGAKGGSKDKNGSSASANTGGGGGGAGGADNKDTYGGAGGSGIIVIRNKR